MGTVGEFGLYSFRGCAAAASPLSSEARSAVDCRERDADFRSIFRFLAGKDTSAL